MARCRMHLDVLAAATVLLLCANGCSLVTSADDPKAQLTTLNVAVVPAVDSASFFVALYGGLFRAQGLSVHFPLSPVDVVRIQRVADVMRQFLGGQRFDVAEMITAPSQ